MEQSEEIGELAKALSKAQSQIMKAKKDAKNPFYKSTYSTLESCWDACREPLTKNGLSIVQFPGPSDTLVTQLCHESGEWIRERFECKPVKNDPQAKGSAISYARRYALCAVVGISAEDDDGNAASEKKTTQQPRQNAASSQPITTPLPKTVGRGGDEPEDKSEVISDGQRKRLFALMKDANWTESEMRQYLFTMFGYESTKDIEWRKYEAVCEPLVNKQTFEETIGFGGLL